MHTSTYIHTYTYTHARMSHTHTHTHTHTYTHIGTYLYTYVCTYVRTMHYITLHYIIYNLIPVIEIINFMLFISNILKGFWQFYFPCMHNFQVQTFLGTLQHSRPVSFSTYSNSFTHRLLRIPKHRQVAHASNVWLISGSIRFQSHLAYDYCDCTVLHFISYSGLTAQCCFTSTLTLNHRCPFHFTVHNYYNSSFSAKF